MPSKPNALAVARDNVLIVCAFFFCVLVCVLLIVSFSVAVLTGFAAAGVLGAWDRLKRRQVGGPR